MLLGMTNRLRIGMAASPADDHLCNSFDGPAEYKSTPTLASWRNAVERLMRFLLTWKKKVSLEQKYNPVTCLYPENHIYALKSDFGWGGVAWSGESLLKKNKIVAQDQNNDDRKNCRPVFYCAGEFCCINTQKNIWNQISPKKRRLFCESFVVCFIVRKAEKLHPWPSAEKESSWVYWPELQAGGRRGSCCPAVSGSASLYSVWSFTLRRRV